MDLFRLTYFVGGDESEPDSKWRTNHRFEVYGSGEAICDLYFHLKCLKELHNKGLHESSCPKFIEIKNKDGQNLTEIYKKHGILGVISNTENTFK